MSLDNYNNVNIAELRREGGELKKENKIKMNKLTWYDVWWDKEGNPGDDNKKAGRQIVGDDI